jgi:DUF4097 and DUF4098 domain-containing protein YvlB
MNITIRQNGGGAGNMQELRIGPHTFGIDGSIPVTIEVHGDVTGKVQSMSGDIMVAGNAGDVETMSGSVRVVGRCGDIETMSGKVNVGKFD